MNQVIIKRKEVAVSTRGRPQRHYLVAVTGVHAKNAHQGLHTCGHIPFHENDLAIRGSGQGGDVVCDDKGHTAGSWIQAKEPRSPSAVGSGEINVAVRFDRHGPDPVASRSREEGGHLVVVPGVDAYDANANDLAIG